MCVCVCMCVVGVFTHQHQLYKTNTKFSTNNSEVHFQYAPFEDVALGKERVDDDLKDWDEDQDEHWVEGLHLVRLD